MLKDILSITHYQFISKFGMIHFCVGLLSGKHGSNFNFRAYFRKGFESNLLLGDFFPLSKKSERRTTSSSRNLRCLSLLSNMSLNSGSMSKSNPESSSSSWTRLILWCRQALLQCWKLRSILVLVVMVIGDLTDFGCIFPLEIVGWYEDWNVEKEAL